MIDALPRGEIGGQPAPLAPALGHIKDGIEHGPHTQGAGASPAFGGWDHLFDPLPFLVGQVAWICFFVHIPMLHNPRRLFRQALTVYHSPPGLSASSSSLSRRAWLWTFMPCWIRSWTCCASGAVRLTEPSRAG